VPGLYSVLFLLHVLFLIHFYLNKLVHMYFDRGEFIKMHDGALARTPPNVFDNKWLLGSPASGALRTRCARATIDVRFMARARSRERGEGTRKKAADRFFVQCTKIRVGTDQALRVVVMKLFLIPGF